MDASDESSNEDDNEEAQAPVKKESSEAVTQIKAASQYCCFVKSDGKTLVLCSQNTSIKQEVHSSLQ